ncbi:MAG: PspC domain-containing protein [bacterium]|nr:PspC domain-containing protein [bacterium]
MGMEPTPTKRLARSRTDRQIAGVAGGLAVYFNTDPTIIRILFVVLALVGGPGLLLYIILALVMPEAD